jgi:16S rRNA (uracil1498-N3)-methyltransferase
MFNFFCENKSRDGDCYFITGADYNHIKNVLRMNIGDSFLVSCGNSSDLCEIESIENETITAKIIEENYQNTNLPIKIYLFQGLPKADKMELIIQKAVELGAYEIIPVATKRAIVKLDAKKEASKIKRWQAIAEGAAKQSGRMLVPQISGVKTFQDALKMAQELDINIIPYECARGMDGTREIFGNIKPGMSVGIFIGPEGGFEESEVEAAKALDVKPVTLGKRILRTETAGLTTLSILMYLLEESN